MITYVLVIIVTAFIFDFINGFHDSANSIATVVGTRVLSPVLAVGWAAFFNFVAAFVIGTVGQRITRLKPVGGFAAETGGALSIFLATFLGIPVSTTHTISGSIVGVGAVNRISSVRWGIAGRIVWAWVLTIPVSAAVGAICYGLLRVIGLD